MNDVRVCEGIVAPEEGAEAYKPQSQKDQDGESEEESEGAARAGPGGCHGNPAP